MFDKIPFKCSRPASTLGGSLAVLVCCSKIEVSNIYLQSENEC